jgi:dienelactone hydrolase
MVITLIVHPGGPHSLFCYQRNSYSPDAAQDAWELLLKFFRKYLQA